MEHVSQITRPVFAKFGRIFNIKYNWQKQCAFVNFLNVEDATRAAHALTGKLIGNIQVRVNYARVGSLSFQDDDQNSASKGPYRSHYRNREEE